MKRHTLSVLSLVSLAACGDPNIGQTGMRSGIGNAGPVAGTIDGVDWINDRLVIHGWACQSSVAQSINVHVYVGGPAGTGAILGGYLANAPRESAVSNACNTVGIPHGFSIAIPRADLTAHAGKTIFVYGISTTNNGNPALDHSGTFSVPNPLPAAAVRLSDRVRGLAPNADLSIAAGETVEIDTNADVGVINVGGTLRCPATGAFTISTAGISVMGAGALFECGSSDAGRFTGSLTIAIKPGRTLPHGGERALAVGDGGTLRLFGQRRTHFVKLAARANAGSAQLTLTGPVDWKVGDTVAIGPSGFNYAEAESRQITAVSADRLTLTLAAPLQFTHDAFNTTYPHPTLRLDAPLDERPEVADLTRNIVITAAGDAAQLDAQKLGAHVMVMAGGRAFVDSVELTRVGRLGELGRYPFHWHLVGDGREQFIRNSSVHHSYQRCVTIHGTSNATVQDNVCFDHIGHGYFLEQGNEVDNTITGNLGMLSRRAPLDRGLLVSDSVSTDRPRFSAPATFWIANPRNTVSNNVASGSQGTGFWMAFNRELECSTNYSCTVVTDDNRAGRTVTDRPSGQPTTQFDFNTAHASEVGITWDGAEDGPRYDDFRRQHPEVGDPLPGLSARNANARVTQSTEYAHGLPIASAPVFRRLTVFKNVASGVYFRGERATFENFIAADNGFSAFFAYNQVVNGGLFVGASAGVTSADLAYATAIAPDFRLTSFAGVRMYDGPFELFNVHFADFRARTVGATTVRAWPFVNTSGANRTVSLNGHTVNRSQTLTFQAGTIDQRMALAGESNNFDALGFFDAPWSVGVRDVDGTLSGTAGSLVLPNHPLNNADGCRRLDASVGDGYACPHDWGFLALFGSQLPAPHNANSFPFTIERIDEMTQQVVSSGVPATGRLNNKTGLFITPRYRYRLSSTVIPIRLSMDWLSERHPPQAAAPTPIIEIVGATACRPNGAPLTTLDALRRDASAAGYALSGGSLFFRLAPGHADFVCG